MRDFPWHEADAMFLVLTRRARDLEASECGSREEELDHVKNAMAAYEAKRWPQMPTTKPASIASSIRERRRSPNSGSGSTPLLVRRLPNLRFIDTSRE